jgi:hypothetical protein
MIPLLPAAGHWDRLHDASFTSSRTLGQFHDLSFTSSRTLGRLHSLLNSFGRKSALVLNSLHFSGKNVQFAKPPQIYNYIFGLPSNTSVVMVTS